MRPPVLLGLAMGSCVLALSAQSGAGANGQEGGIFRISFSPAAGLDHVDPALSFTAPGWALLDATCARLMSYPDKPPPAGLPAPCGKSRPASEVSSDDLRTYTFTLRRGFRFSDGEPRPSRAPSRTRSTERSRPWRTRLERCTCRTIVGAADVLAGRTGNGHGCGRKGQDARRSTSRRPAPDFPARTAMPFFCAVPANAAAQRRRSRRVPRRQARTTSTEYRPGERVVIRRNRFYGGTRALCTSTGSTSISAEDRPRT